MNVADRHGVTALMNAAMTGRDKNVTLLIKAEADVNIMSQCGNSAIAYASQFGHQNCLAKLLAAGADVNNRQASLLFYTPLMYAAYNGHDNCLTKLVKAGADVNATTRSGRTPLMFAVKGCNLKCTQFHCLLIIIICL